MTLDQKAKQRIHLTALKEALARVRRIMIRIEQENPRLASWIEVTYDSFKTFVQGKDIIEFDMDEKLETVYVSEFKTIKHA